MYAIRSYYEQYRTGKFFKISYSKPEINGFYPAMAWHSGIVKIEGKSFCRNPVVVLTNGSKKEFLKVIKSSSDFIRNNFV